MTNADRSAADTTLERTISDVLFTDPKIRVGASIDVSVVEGRATLRGTVGSFREKREARNAAGLVDGVKLVEDELEVLGPSDQDVQRAVVEALEMDGRIPATIDVKVNEGSVTLAGSVQREGQRNAATFIAENVPEVVEVDNQIKVGNIGRDSADAQGRVENALDRLTRLDFDGLSEGERGSRLELRDRLAAAGRRIERLRSNSEAAGNVVRFHLARYIESLESDAIDAADRLATLTDKRSYEESILERDVTALEADLAGAEAKLDAAQAEERGDFHGEVQAQLRVRGRG